ncbi:hypothetical protein NUACC21_74210 [Scytonema sp. NUACC21]
MLSGEYQPGLEAIQKGRYSTAIQLLEKFCQECQVDPQANFKEYIQAQMGLVKAYHCTGEQQKAIALCQQLAASKHSQVRAWAQRILPSLSTPTESAESSPAETQLAETQTTPEPTVAEKVYLTPEQAAELLASGSKALKFKRFADAVNALEQYSQGVDAGTKDYSQAQMWLVKAYKGNEQLENAIALCQQLTAHEQEVTRIWARQFLETLSPNAIPASVGNQTATESSSQEQPHTTLASGQDIVVEFKLKSWNEFKSFCQNQLLNELKAVENTRKEVLRSISFVGITLFIIAGGIIHFFTSSFLNFSSRYSPRPSALIVFLFLLALLTCCWLWVAFYTSATEAYASGFRSKIIERIFDFINTNKTLKYSSFSSDLDTELTMSAFIHSKLFQTLLKPNKIQQNDCISGVIGETHIFFSEIFAQVEVSHVWAKYLNFTQQIVTLNSLLPRFITRRIILFLLPLYIIVFLIKFLKGLPYVATRMIKGRKIDYKRFEEEIIKNEYSRKTVFKGLFFRARFNKTLKGKTVVLPQLYNSNINSLNLRKGQLVKLEDPEFSQLFTAYGDDQVEARYILSTNLMSKLVKFRKKARRNIYVSFVENMIYIAIEYPEDIFEPKLFHTMLSFAPMGEYFESIQLMLGIVEDLNLNRRIWGNN